MSRTDRPDTDPQDAESPVLDFRRRFALWNNLSFWRQWAVGASLAAIALLAVAVLHTPAAPGYVAVLTPDDDRPAWLVTANTADGVFIVRPVGALNTGGQSYELWMISGDGVPRSLGTVGSSGETAIPLDVELARRIAGIVLAIAPEGEPPRAISDRPIYRGQLLPLEPVNTP